MTDIKTDMKDFYATEAKDRETREWLEAGGSARVPETKASHYFIDRKVDTALAMAKAPNGSRVLEVGSSFGHMTFLLARHFSQVTAVDLSPESIDLARRRAERWKVPNVRFEVADAEHLAAFDDGGFDVVFSFSTLRFCPNPAAALAEFRRVVRPGGAVVVDFPNAQCPWYGPIKRRMAIEPHVHDRLFTADEARSLMQDAGFRDIRARYLLFTSKRVPDASLPLFRVLDPVLESLPGIQGFAGIVMVEGRRDPAG